MMPDYMKKIGTKDKPLELTAPPGTSSYTELTLSICGYYESTT